MSTVEGSLMKIIAAIFVKAFWSLCATALFLIPFWIWLSAWYLMTPEGFWQKALLVGVGLWFLGFFQLICLIFLSVVLVIVWD